MVLQYQLRKSDQDQSLKDSPWCWQLPDGIRTSGGIAEVPRFPLNNFHGKMMQQITQITQTIVAPTPVRKPADIDLNLNLNPDLDTYMHMYVYRKSSPSKASMG